MHTVFFVFWLSFLQWPSELSEFILHSAEQFFRIFYITYNTLVPLLVATLNGGHSPLNVAMQTSLPLQTWMHLLLPLTKDHLSIVATIS